MLKQDIAAILLAAGSSSRMGQPKLFLPLGNGQSMLENAVRLLQSVGLKPTVISGAYHLRILQHLAAPLQKGAVEVIYNPNWKSGMGTSIASGVSGKPAANNYLITLADQPGVTADFLARLLAEAEQHPTSIIATTYPEGPGVPALFPARYREALLEPTTSGGGKGLLRNQATAVRTITPTATLVDLDTPEDYYHYTGKELPDLEGNSANN